MNSINISKISGDMKNKLKQALGLVGRQSVSLIKKSIAINYPPASEPGNPPHRRTGNLFNNIYSGVHVEINDMVLTIYADVPYSKFLEKGTHKMEARPFIEPVIKKHTAMLQTAINEAK